VFNIDYRNGPECKLPENTMDCYAGLKYVLEYAEEYNIDTSKIAIWGEGAGALMAVGLAKQLAK
jgi:acetyl esterase